MSAKGCIFLCFLPIWFNSRAQLPKTDIYLAIFSNLSTTPRLQNLTFLNDFNKNGYNNQPQFVSQDELFLTVGKDSSKFTELYKFNITTKEYYKFTETDAISEFSGNTSPLTGRMTCVRIEDDGKDQSLWSYPEDRSNTGKRILPNLKNVGYYCWIDKNQVALFLVGSPYKLVIADIHSGKSTLISENIGRCLRNDGKGNLYYVHKITSDTWQLKAYNLTMKTAKVICQMPATKEDYELLPNGHIITTEGSKIKMFRPDTSSEWTEIADFSDRNIKNINRITVSGNKLVFVNNK